MSGDLYVSDTPQRFAFTMLAKEGYASQGTATLAVAPDGTPPTDFVETTLHEAGLPERRGVYVADLVFDKEGVWDGTAVPRRREAAVRVPSEGEGRRTDGRRHGAEQRVADDDRDARCRPDLHPRPGVPAAHGVVDTVIATGKPVAALFATRRALSVAVLRPGARQPAAARRDVPDRVDFVHVEIYKDRPAHRRRPDGDRVEPPERAVALRRRRRRPRSRPRLDGAFGGRDEGVLDAATRPAPTGPTRSDPAGRGPTCATELENDWPQPQVRVAFGLLIVNPAPWRPSL